MAQVVGTLSESHTISCDMYQASHFRSHGMVLIETPLKECMPLISDIDSTKSFTVFLLFVVLSTLINQI